MNPDELFLCFVRDHFAWFTDAPLGWLEGEEWDAPLSERVQLPPHPVTGFTLLKAAWEGWLQIPERSLAYSPRQINDDDNCTMFWLETAPYAPPDTIQFLLGPISLRTFIEKVEQVGGTVYLPQRADELPGRFRQLFEQAKQVNTEEAWAKLNAHLAPRRTPEEEALYEGDPSPEEFGKRVSEHMAPKFRQAISDAIESHINPPRLKGAVIDHWQPAGDWNQVRQAAPFHNRWAKPVLKPAPHAAAPKEEPVTEELPAVEASEPQPPIEEKEVTMRDSLDAIMHMRGVSPLKPKG